MGKEEERSFHKPLLQWFDNHGRHDLPWQHPRSPYRVWISEIMLQQTQVTTVIPYFNQFMHTFPSVEALATADLDDVLTRWSGLGYYARARNLHLAAKTIVEEHQGQLPADLQQLQALPGIGRSTAGAIMALGHNQKATILDGNVKRVLTRYEAIEGWSGKTSVANQLWQIAEQYTPDERVIDYTQAMMDLGATLCRRNNPVCSKCPLNQQCKAFLTNRTDELPTRKPKRRIPTVERYVLIKVSPESHVYLERRAPTGIWGGLFSFPESTKNAGFSEAMSEFNLNENASLQIAAELKPITHTFSHYHLKLIPLICHVDQVTGIEENRGQWFEPPVTTVGLPAPIEKWLNSPDNIESIISHT